MTAGASKRRSVILLSGGLDSAANLAFCREQDLPVLALTADYGQRAAQAELRASKELCKYYEVPHETVDLRWLGKLGGSSLTDSGLEVPVLAAEQLDQSNVTTRSAKSVWVPNRNGVLINVAAAYAERTEAERVVVGFNVEEAATFPDNSEAFLRQASAALGTANGVRVFSYTEAWNKRQIVRELKKLSRPFPFGQVWSCYLGGERPCRTCESCRRMARAIAD